MMNLHLSSSSLISTITHQQQRKIKCLQDPIETRKNLIKTDCISSLSLCPCGRRHFLGAMTSVPLLRISSSSYASSPTEVLKRLHPPKQDWYEEFFAWSMNTGMEPYEKEVSYYKMKLFNNLVGKVEKVLEIGVGTGPNFKYYADIPNVSVLGLDPNAKMESYARKSAVESGLKSENFRFIHALGESIPLEDSSVDLVVGTLVLCSVTNVTMTLKEIKRILKPRGMYIFIEHVAAKDGSFLRLVQNVLDPLQQVVADGCHLTRDTGKYIVEARFNGGLDIEKATISSSSYISPHVYGVAYN
ncbi:unnamed protein product [Cochlearia groenlandica]